MRCCNIFKTDVGLEVYLVLELIAKEQGREDASGGALASYVDGTHGLDTAAHMQALYNLVVNIRAALVANGIMS